MGEDQGSEMPIRHVGEDVELACRPGRSSGGGLGQRYTLGSRWRAVGLEAVSLRGP